MQDAAWEGTMAFCRNPQSHSVKNWLAAIAVAALPALFTAPSANAQLPGIMNRGDTIVSAFAGVVPGVPPFPSGNPIDETFIDLNGPSLQIQRPMPAAPPMGQLVPSPTVFTARARDVGQVGAITIDD